MKWSNLAVLSRLSQAYGSKRPLICLGGTANRSVGVSIALNFSKNFQKDLLSNTQINHITHVLLY